MTQLAHILLVEDDPGDAHLALAVLQELDLADSVFVVPDGVIALDYLYSREAFRDRPVGYPTLVLLDMKLPRIDGLEMLTQMRADPVLRIIPVVMLTSSREERDVRRAYEIGANGYVVKTINFAAYHKALHDLVQYWLFVNEPAPGSLRLAKP